MTMIFAVIIAALFVMYLAGVAMAMEGMQGNADILFGKITAVDTSPLTKSLTLQSSATWGPTLNIFVNEDTAVKICDAERSLKDINVGSKVQVTYYELAGVAVADFIYLPC
jgi:predicted sugar kinase